jgi:hypothetical protein
MSQSEDKKLFPEFFTIIKRIRARENKLHLIIS